MLSRRDLDMAIIQDWANAPLALPDGLSKAPIMDDVADIALPSAHRLARAKVVKLDDLANEPWITWLEGSIRHDWLLHTLRRRGHEPRVAHTASEYRDAAGAGWCGPGRRGHSQAGARSGAEGREGGAVGADAAPACICGVAAGCVPSQCDSRRGGRVSAGGYFLMYLSHVPTSIAAGPLAAM